jgi:transcriptional regulator with XRE-family HTH domain
MTLPMPDQEAQPQGTNSELASFGEELRREREIRGISLKEISDATKISKRFLDALERNDHRTLPAPVFTRGFVREYARYVGLNAEEMVNRYNYAAAKDDRIDKPPQIEKYPQTPVRDITPKPPPKRGIPPAYARVDRNAVILVVIVALLAAVAFWAVRSKRVDLDTFSQSEPPAAIATPAKAALPPPQPAPKPDDSKLRLSLDVSSNSWVTLEADGETVVNTEMTAGEKRTFEADEEFKFRTIGNAAGITLRLNDIEIPPLGDDGEVVKNRVFNRQSLADLRLGQQQEQQP